MEFLKTLIQYPAYIFKFALYVLFIVIAGLFYFSDNLAMADQSVKSAMSIAMFLYGAYRMIRTYQDFKKEISSDK
jgi:prepilin signal peptidase PulO-like enzyme (type II secretory pathway)